MICTESLSVHARRVPARRSRSLQVEWWELSRKQEGEPDCVARGFTREFLRLRRQQFFGVLALSLDPTSRPSPVPMGFSFKWP